MTAHAPALLLGRILASAIFIISGVGKLMAIGPTTAYFASAGLPLPDFATYVAILIELGGGILLLLGFQTRLTAILLAVFCVVTAGIAHAHFGDRAQLINFLKNLCMAGGFLAFVAAGGGALSIDGLRRNRIVIPRAPG